MKRTLILLFLITAIAALLRSLNLSSFTIYPDSYQNLLVAENIAVYHSVLGYLGPGGMLYPDFFMWTRPVYALLINGLNFFIHDSFLSARIIAYFLGVLAIPLSFFVLKSALGPSTSLRQKSTQSSSLSEVEGLKINDFGFAAAALLAFSYNHTIWSGLVMTESTGVFFMLLFLWSFFTRVKKKTELLNFKDLLCGILCAIAVLTRYEYLIILVPIVYLISQMSPTPRIILTNLILSLTFMLALAIFTLFPWQSVIPVILEQLFELLVRAGVIVLLFFVGFLIYRKLSKKQKASLNKFLPKFILLCLVVFAGYAVVSGQLPFLTNFARHDILISILALIGLMFMLRPSTGSGKKGLGYSFYSLSEVEGLRPLAYFSLIAIVSLLFIYHRINPNMERYLTHIIPFLLIPASFGLIYILQISHALNTKSEARNSKQLQNSNDKNSKRFGISDLKYSGLFRISKFGFRILLMVLLILQLNISSQGLRSLSDPSWYRNSYEEKVAEKLQTWIPDQVRDDGILIASMPEPYYFRLRLTTHSISDAPPYIYIPDSLNDRTVLIIQDMGMRDVFPHFNNILDTKLQKYKKSEFKVNGTYHTANVSIPENDPVVVYEIKLGELRKLLN